MTTPPSPVYYYHHCPTRKEYYFGRPEVQGFDVTLSKPVVPYEKLSLRGK
ncbi:MAG: hypothetical protein HC794_04985 [Nitrospiraceae bacterium]|nr:hypothetical protein [Nitrospiraceae bacterium]